MGRGSFLTLSVIATAVEPVVAGEQDFIRYAMTQGGLLIVVLICLAYIKVLHQREVADKQQQVDDKDEKLQAMITLATEQKVMMSKILDATAAQAAAASKTAETMQKMAETLAVIDQRKNPR